MAREIGSLYYTLGIKGSADFQRTLEQARQAVMKMPKGTTTAGVTTFDSKQLSKFGSEIERVMKSGAATFNAEISRSITKQSRDLEAMVAQLGPRSRKGRSIQEILDIRNASGGVGVQKASPNEILRALKQKERFELSLETPTKQRKSSEAVLRGFLGSGKIKEGEAITEYLRAGAAELKAQEDIQNRLMNATLVSNKAIADAHINYQSSAQSASDLLELQRQINLATHEEQRARNSILATQERQRAAALNDKYAFVESRGNKYSRESVMLGNAAFSDASSDRKLRMRAAATADIDQQIARKRAILEDPAYKDQTSKIAMDLKLEIDGLVRVREELAMLADEMDEFIEKQGLAPRALPNSVGFAIDQEKAKEDLLNTGADLTGTSTQDQVAAFNKAKKQREIDAIVSNTKTGRYTGFQSQSVDEIKKAQDLLNKNAAGTISLTRDQEVALKNHITQWQKLGQLSRNVLDIMSKMVDEQDQLSAAMAAGDTSGIEQHRKNLNALSNDLDKAVSAVNKHNSGLHDASVENNRWNTQMMELGYGVQDFVQVLSGGGGLSAALRGASNNFSQFFAVGGGPHAALMATGMALGTLGISMAMDHLGNSTEDTTKKFDDLIERLRTAENISKEYAKHGTNMLEASFGEGSSLMPQIAALQIELASSKKIMEQTLRGELAGKGEGSVNSGFKGLIGKTDASRMTFGEKYSALWRTGTIRNLTSDTDLPFGIHQNTMTNSWAAQGVFERVLKQIFVEQRRPDQLVMPEMLMESLTKREKEIFAELTSTYSTTNEAGVAEQHFKYKDKLDEAMRLYVEAGGLASDEMKRFANQVGEATEKLKMLIEVQTKRTKAYVFRTGFLAATEKSISAGSGEYANQRRGMYADDLIEATKEYTDAQSGALKDLAIEKARSAMSGFSNIATTGKFEGAGSELANLAASASEANLERKSKLAQIMNQEGLPDQVKGFAGDMIKSLDKQLPDQIMAGARKIASGISPDQRVGESLAAMQDRVNSEIGDFVKELEKLRNSGKLTANQFSELEKITRAMGEAAKILVAKNKAIRGVDVALAGGIGMDKRREDEDFLRREAAINKDFINATADIQTEFAKSAKTDEDTRVRDARLKDAETKRTRSMGDLEADKKKAALDRELRRSEYDAAGTPWLSRGFRDYDKSMGEAKRRFEEEKLAADNELRDNKDQDLYNKRMQAAKLQHETEKADIRKQYFRDSFSSRSMLGSDIAANLGGREGRKYQEEMNRIERMRRIEDDKFMTPEQKRAALVIEDDLYNSNMKQIDRKNVSFTDVGSAWKTIQGSLQNYDKKMLDYWKQYMDLARGEGVRVKMAIGN